MSPIPIILLVKSIHEPNNIGFTDFLLIEPLYTFPRIEEIATTNQVAMHYIKSFNDIACLFHFRCRKEEENTLIKKARSRSRMRVRPRFTNFQYRRGERIGYFIGKYLCHP